MSPIADLELAVEAARAQTDGHLATARMFAWLAEQIYPATVDMTRSKDERDMAVADLELNSQQAVAAEKDYHTAALAELTARRELDEARKHPWMPIATAPKDGESILVVAHGQGIVIARWCDEWVGDEGWFDDDDVEVTPTHWMPLPAGPEVRS